MSSVLPKEPENIRNELETALRMEMDFTASFSFKQEYPSAPNPSLKIQEIGTVGVPLSNRDASAIKSVAEQAPFGMGERTVLDKAVRDTWEIDGTKVEFGNPHWKPFMTDAVTATCKALGVNFAASQPRCELYKLLLYETGSHFLPHVDTEKADGMFATIIVVLPAEFTGGEAHLSHGSFSTVYDTSQGSTYKTTVLAWYTDVTHEIKPITSGYRLALAYNLIHTTQSLRPAVSLNLGFIERVRGILLSWSKLAALDASNIPTKILYLLDHKYSQASLRASALKGADDHRVALLDVIAKELGFHIGFASVECHLQGAGDDDGYHSHRYGGWGYGDSESSDNDDDDVDFLEVYERDISVEEFVDVDGNLIAKTLEFDEDLETIPASLTEDIESGPYDDQEYEGYVGNGAGSLDRWYRRTVLVIWPDAYDCDIRFGGGNFDHACKVFDKPEVSHTTRLKVTEYLLKNAARNPSLVANTICRFALQEDDLTLWERCIKSCSAKRGFSAFKRNEICEAICAFGFEKVKPSLNGLLLLDASNRQRYKFLKRMQEWAKSNSAEPQEDILVWVEDQTSLFLRNLKKPMKDEHTFLVELAISHGGIDFLHESVLPQILDQSVGHFLLSLAIEIFKNTQLPRSATKTAVVKKLLCKAISSSRLESMQKQAAPSPHLQHGYPWYTSSAPARMDPNPVFLVAKTYIQACYELRHQDLVGMILEKLATFLEDPSMPGAETQAKEVVLPVLCYLRARRIASEHSDSIPHLKALLKPAVEVYLNSLISPPLFVTQESISTLLQTTLLDDKFELFASSVLPKLSQIPSNVVGIENIFLELHKWQSQLSLPEGYSGISVEAVVLGLAKKYATVAQAVAVTAVLIQRMFNHIKSSYHVDQVLLPVAASFHDFIKKYGLDALALASQAIMVGFIDKILGKKPTMDATAVEASIVRWPCSCSYCTRTKSFLKDSSERQLTMPHIGANNKKHLEQQLARYASTVAIYEMIRSKPQGFTISKTDELYQSILWKANHAKGLLLLKTLSSDEGELQHLLGEHYDKVCAALLRGTKRQDPPSSMAQAVVETSTSGGGSQPAKRRRVAPDLNNVIDLTSD